MIHLLFFIFWWPFNSNWTDDILCVDNFVCDILTGRVRGKQNHDFQLSLGQMFRQILRTLVISKNVQNDLVKCRAFATVSSLEQEQIGLWILFRFLSQGIENWMNKFFVHI